MYVVSRNLEAWIRGLTRRPHVMGILAGVSALAGFGASELAPERFRQMGMLPSLSVAAPEHLELPAPAPLPPRVIEPDLTALIPSIADNVVARDALRNILEGDQEARQLDLPTWPSVTGDVPLKGGPSLPARSWYVVDDETGEVLLAHNADIPYPIASISKLMGMMVYADSLRDQDESITLLEEDKNFIQITRSRLRVGARYRAGDLLYHSLLPSDNRATVALMRQTGLPLEVFRDSMNRRAEALGLRSAVFAEPTGLDSGNVASARDAALLLEAALSHPIVSEVVKSKEHWYYRDDKPIMLGARSSNRLSHNETWSVVASKTGFTYAAGSCLVQKSRLEDGRMVTMVILGATGEKGRYPVAEAIRRYLSEELG